MCPFVQQTNNLQLTKWSQQEAQNLQQRMEQMVGSVTHISFRPDAKVVCEVEWRGGGGATGY